MSMAKAFIIDQCRTRRGIGKQSKTISYEEISLPTH